MAEKYAKDNVRLPAISVNLNYTLHLNYARQFKCLFKFDFMNLYLS